MTFELPALDPLWLSVGVTAVLVIITILYVYYTKRMTDISQMALLYQRKPNFIIKIENYDNDIHLSLKNNENSISPVSKIKVNVYMNINNKKMKIGKYHIDEPLFPGEEDSSNITKMIKKNLKDLKLMEHREERNTVYEDDEGNPYFPTFFDITKSNIKFEIITEASFETDLEKPKEKCFNLFRIFEVNLKQIFAPLDSLYDLYETSIKMKMGKWI